MRVMHTTLPVPDRVKRAPYSCELLEPPSFPVESGSISDSVSYYTVFGRGDDTLRACRGDFLHEVAFLYKSSENDLETDPIVRARKMMRNYR